MRVIIEVDKGTVTAVYADGDMEVILIDHDVEEVDEVGVNTDPEEMAEALEQVKDYKRADLLRKC